MLEKYNQLACLPSAEDLPNSDDTPVDNELQDLIPGLLKAILAIVWSQRWDWFFGIDMGFYYQKEEPAIIPDGFLVLGVQRIKEERLRLSYVLWEEKQVPVMTLEVVSQKRRKEYSGKKDIYAEQGILYYVIYNPQRRRLPSLEVYRLVDGDYQLQLGNPVWLPEVGLGIGCERGTYQGITREWLYWYNERGERLLTPEERISSAEQQVERLREQLRSLGVDPDSLM